MAIQISLRKCADSKKNVLKKFTVTQFTVLGRFLHLFLCPGSQSGIIGNVRLGFFQDMRDYFGYLTPDKAKQSRYTEFPEILIPRKVTTGREIDSECLNTKI